MQHHMAQGIPHLPVPHASRPILAIDTAPHHPVNRHPSLAVPRDMTLREHRSTRTIHDQLLPSASGKLVTSTPGLSQSINIFAISKKNLNLLRHYDTLYHATMLTPSFPCRVRQTAY